MRNGEEGYASFGNGEETWRFSYVPTTINDWYVVTIVPDHVIMNQADYISQMALVLCVKIGLALALVGVYVAVSHQRNERKEREHRELSRMDNARYRVLLENYGCSVF